MSIAKQALSAAQATEERLTAVMTQFGLNSPFPRDAPSVQILLDEIQHPSHTNTSSTPT
jgi:hypothetical protein